MPTDSEIEPCGIEHSLGSRLMYRYLMGSGGVTAIPL